MDKFNTETSNLYPPGQTQEPIPNPVPPGTTTAPIPGTGFFTWTCNGPNTAAVGNFVYCYKCNPAPRVPTPIYPTNPSLQDHVENTTNGVE